jgi:ABC-type branched-subunit amino acid transport system ATPase component
VVTILRAGQNAPAALKIAHRAYVLERGGWCFLAAPVNCLKMIG